MSRATEVTGGSSPELDIFFDEVVKKIDFPVIVADSLGNPLPGGYRDVPLKNPTHDQLRTVMKRLDLERPPIVLHSMRGRDTVVLQQVHYGLSPFVRILRVFPVLRLAMFILFVLLGLWGILAHARREQERIWVAMARETAHQFATPLSSLGAWVDMLSEATRRGGAHPSSGDRHERGVRVSDLACADGALSSEMATAELRRDLLRMQEILERFSRIGRPPDLKLGRVGHVTRHTAEFVRRRTSRPILFEVDASADPLVWADEVLISWAIENLLRDGVDAIGGALV